MKLKFKLFLAMILAVGLLAACGGNDDVEEDTADNNTADETTDETDVVTAASFVTDEEGMHAAAGENGTWIIIATEDLTLEDELVVTGTFHDKADEANDIYRKIAAYDQDEDKNITAQYTITTPRLVVQSENLNFQGGTLDGDVYVEADGFQLHETSTVTGDIIFANEDVEASADIAGTVEGETIVE
ncbi:hypothetical protein [Amphibacillus sp. MSJ-3]|uniref:hypothetical protein n=1 Tax=Amphibacillus sp. MSJ-3 TaxID=2841505 RepID=UPI00209C93BA|nr:hypothetical protein [Amphibacillus sp. MSJ-3]